MDMHLDGARAEAQSRRDLAAAEPAGDQPSHLELAWGKTTSADSGGGKTAEAPLDLLPQPGDLISDPGRKRPCSQMDGCPVHAPIPRHGCLPVAGQRMRRC